MRLSVLLAAVSLSVVGLSIADESHASMKQSTYIPPQPLGAALQALAKDRGFQVVYESAQINPLQTKGATGELTSEEALTQLLLGTGMTYKFYDGNAVSILPINAKTPRQARIESANSGAPGADQSKGEGKDTSSSFRLAQATQGASESDVPVDKDKQSEPDSEKKTALEEITVTGSHIRGEAPPGVNVIVIDRDQIDKSGYARIGDLLATVPQNFTGVSETFNQTNVSNLARGSEVQLRGLGPGTTLTLLDGQRLPTGGTYGAFVDISSIPLAAIERIEILPDGASALYGSDAIGGVVNIVLRKDYQGAETRARFAEASGGQAKQEQASQLFGIHWDSGHITLGYQYFRQDDFTQGSRDYTATGDLVPFGGSDFRYPAGNPGNILNAARQPVYAIPVGQNGTGLTIAQLIKGGVNYQDVSYVDIQPAETQHSGFANLSQDFDDRAEIFLTALYSTRAVTVIGPGSTRTLTVPATNPFYINPFGGNAPVRVQYDFTQDLGTSNQPSTTDTLSSQAGIKINLPANWQMKLSGVYGHETTDWNWTNLLNTTALNAALADPNPSTALNVFGDGSNTNPATLAGIRKNANETGVSAVYSASAIVDGPMMELPGGPSRVAVGVEERHEKESVSALNYDPFKYTSSSRVDFAAFAEVALPLVSETQGLPGMRKFEVSVADRYDRYSDVGSTSNPKIGVAWSVIDKLQFRGTWGRSFRAPPFYLSNAAIENARASAQLVPDNASPTHTVNALVLTGTNPNLRPETAKTWTAGIDVQPTTALSLSANYFDIDYRDKVEAPPDGIDSLNFASRYVNTGVITPSPTQAQINAICGSQIFIKTSDCSGPFAYILNLGVVNLAAANMKGMDFDFDFHRATDFGKFNFRVDGTRIFSDVQAVSATSTGFEIADSVGNPPGLRMRNTLSWSLKNWSATAAVNYVKGYHDVGVPVGSWVTLDMGAGYTIPDGVGFLSNTNVMLNALNVFNRLPPFVNEPTGYDPANANILRFTGSVQLVKNW